MATSIDFSVKEVDRASSENTVRQLVEARLSKDYADCGRLFHQLVDEVTAVVNKVLTSKSQEAVVQSASRPAPDTTVFRSRPVWATKLIVEFNPPQRGSTTGRALWQE